MGLSNYLPSSRISQSGVCTSTTRPASPYEGQVIYETDTDRVLVWNASAWVMPNKPAQNPDGLELITTTTCTSGGTASNGTITIGSGQSSVVVANAFSSTYDTYRVLIENVNFSVADTTFLVRPDNVTTAGYYGGGFFALFTGGGLSQYILNAGNAGGVGITTQTNKGTLIFDISQPFKTEWTRMHGTPSIGNNYIALYTSMLATNASYTGMTVLPAAGTMTGGTIRVYGYRN